MYNTLTLDAEPEERKSRAAQTVAALVLVCVAGAVALYGSTTFSTAGQVADSQYQALDAKPVNCDPTTPSYQDDLPKWDPSYNTQDDFYNACYYSFRCCTTTGNGNGCYVSDNYGAMCRSCLKNNGPRFVRSACADWLSDGTIDNSAWTTDDLMEDNGLPSTSIPQYAVIFENLPSPSCWANRGAGDSMVRDYAEKCFEVLSWCNLLCPRDTPETADHVMCKHCTLFGFQTAYWDKEKFANELAAIGQ